jgi:hypothetical protein
MVYCDCLKLELFWFATQGHGWMEFAPSTRSAQPSQVGDLQSGVRRGQGAVANWNACRLSDSAAGFLRSR